MLFAFLVIMCIIGSLFLLPFIVLLILFIVKRDSVIQTGFGEDFKVILSRLLNDIQSRQYAESERVTTKNEEMSREEALQVLGLTDGANREQIVSSYHKLMKSSHPDKGGSPYFAQKLNQARDRLLGKRKTT